MNSDGHDQRDFDSPDLTHRVREINADQSLSAEEKVRAVNKLSLQRNKEFLKGSQATSSELGKPPVKRLAKHDHHHGHCGSECGRTSFVEREEGEVERKEEAFSPVLCETRPKLLSGGNSSVDDCESCLPCHRSRKCVPIDLAGSHSCMDSSVQSACPVCLVYMATSTEQVLFMRCGHAIHASCFEKYTKVKYNCPLCFKALTDMSAWYKALDATLAQEEMPPEYNNRLTHIICNDCDLKSEAKFHFKYHKCFKCSGYNTRVLSHFDTYGADSALNGRACEESKSAASNDLEATETTGDRSGRVSVGAEGRSDFTDDGDPGSTDDVPQVVRECPVCKSEMGKDECVLRCNHEMHWECFNALKDRNEKCCVCDRHLASVDSVVSALGERVDDGDTPADSELEEVILRKKGPDMRALLSMMRKLKNADGFRFFLLDQRRELRGRRGKTWVSIELPSAR